AGSVLAEQASGSPVLETGAEPELETATDVGAAGNGSFDRTPAGKSRKRERRRKPLRFTRLFGSRSTGASRRKAALNEAVSRQRNLRVARCRWMAQAQACGRRRLKARNGAGRPGGRARRKMREPRGESPKSI